MAIALWEIMSPSGTPFTEEEAENLQVGQEICLPNADAPPPLPGGLTAEQKRRAEQYTSIFENDTIKLQYYQPSAKRADAAGLKFALSRAVLYDTIIQHGEGDDPDGLPALLKRTEKQAGGTPKKGIDEKQWLKTFLKVRRADLLDPYNEDTKDEWSKSVDRCDAFSEILNDGNLDLHGPIHLSSRIPPPIYRGRNACLCIGLQEMCYCLMHGKSVSLPTLSDSRAGKSVEENNWLRASCL